MAIDPKLSIWNANDSQEVTAINYGLGDAGTYLLSEAGTEYHVWNDKGMVKGSSKMTCVRVSARDDNGDEVKNITKQHWPEIKSLTIHEGANGGDASGETDDNMTEFQPVGLNAPLIIGDIPADCYRKIMVRVHIPNSGIEGAVTFQIYVLNQEPSTPIAKWTTGLHGNGVVYQSGGAFAVSIGSPASNLDIEKGLALIDSLEAYYGAAQQYDVSELDNGTYKLYLTSVGVISAIISTSSIPANSIELSRVVISGGVATAVTDKRLFITNIMVGLDAAKTATPTKNQVYIATDTTKLYICFADNTWTQVIPDPNMVTKTGTFTVGKIVKINNATGIIEEGTNTNTDVADAVTKKHEHSNKTELDKLTDGDHDVRTDNPHSVTKAQVNLGNVENLKVKLDATSAPGVGNDNTEGYAVGSRWVDVTNNKEYVCLDASTGAAVWTETTGAGGGASTFVALTDTPANYAGGSLKHVRVNEGETALEFVTLGGGGDMLKSVYDTDTDNIVDKAETVDDGEGNSATAADVKDAVTKKHSQNTDTLLSIATALGDHEYVGTTDSKVVGESVVFGDLLYFDWADGEWKKAKADVYATARSRRIALETKGDGEACLMLVTGYIRDDSAFEFTTATVFLSITTAGATQSTVPSVAGNQIQAVGTAISANIMEYSPSMDIGEVKGEV